jgi:hypothetical protein
MMFAWPFLGAQWAGMLRARILRCIGRFGVLIDAEVREAIGVV